MKPKNNDEEMNITISSGGKSVTTSLKNLRRFNQLLSKGLELRRKRETNEKKRGKPSSKNKVRENAGAVN